MWKILRYTIYICIIVGVFAAAYNIRGVFVIPPAEKYILETTGYDVKIGNFYFSPLSGSIVITKVKVEDFFYADKIIVKVGLKKIIRNLKKPVNYIKQIEIPKIIIDLDIFTNTENMHIEKDTANSGKDFDLSDLNVDLLVHEIILNSKHGSQKFSDTRVSILPKNITMSSLAYPFNRRINLDANMILKENKVFDTTFTLSSYGELESMIEANGIFDLSSLDFNQKINIEKIKYGGFEISESSGSIVKSGQNISLNIKGPFGEIDAAWEDFTRFYSNANLNLSAINNDFKALLEAKIYHNEEEGNLDLKIKDLSFIGFELGNFNFYGTKQTGGIYNISCDYAKDARLEIDYFTDGKYDTRLLIGNKTAGTVSGNIKTGEIKANVKDIDISKMPFIPFLSDTPKGSATVEGEIDEISGKIKFTVKDFQSNRINKTDAYGIIARQSDMYVYNFYKSDNSIVFNTVTQAGDILSTDFKFINNDISNIMRAFGYSNEPISGIASGRIIYEKNGTTEFDIKAYDGILYGNKFSKLEAKGDLNLSRVNIDHFVMKNEDDLLTAYASGLLGFTNRNPVSTFNMRAKNLKIGKAVLSGDITFNGKLGDNGEIKGNVESNLINLSGIAFRDFFANTNISVKKININDFHSENGLSGKFTADLINKSISGGINLKNTDIGTLIPDLDALVNLNLKFTGTFSDPVINMSASVKKGTYLKLPFSFSADCVYKNGYLTVKRSSLVSDRTKASLYGTYSKTDKILIDFENLNEIIINKFVGFRTPIKGEFSGKGTLTSKKDKPNLKMSVKSSDTFVKNVKLKDFQSKIEVYGAKISLSSASAKISDSEIRAQKGSFNITSGKYDLDLSLINTHIGPSDIFGNFLLTGTMYKKKGGSIYKGKVNIHNLWINRHKLSKHELGYTIQNKNLELYKTDENTNSLSISGKFSFGNITKINDFSISKGNAKLDMNANLNDDKFDIKIDAKNIDLDFLTDALDMPVPMTGKTSFSLSSNGSLKDPEFKLQIDSQKGTVFNIPYDKIEIDVDGKKNIADIKTAKLFKKNELSFSVTGKFPFWLDDSMSKTAGKIPLNISYELEDSKMNTLKHISEDFFKPRSGKLNIEGKIEGTVNKINNSGQLNIVGGSFDSKNYFERIKDLTVSIVWDNNTLNINKFTGRSTPGKFNIRGKVNFDGFKITNYAINFFTDNKGIFIKIPQLPLQGSIFSKGILSEVSNGEPKFDLLIEGTPEKPKISGRIVLENTKFSFPPPDNDDTIDFPEATEFDIELISGKNTKYENSFASAWINGKLNIRGPYDNIKATGIIDSNRGNIDYLGINFTILNTKLEMTGDNVYITGEAETEVYSAGKSESEKIRMVIDKSEIDSPSIRFYSKDDPTMDSKTALAKVTGTEEGENTTTSQLIGLSDFALRQQALRLIDSSIATPLARTVLRKTGIIDNFRVSYVLPEHDLSLTEDPTFIDLLYGTKYSLEKNLTNQFLLGYSVTFDQIEKKLDLKHEIEMKYRLSNNLFLSGSYELESETSLHKPDRKLMLQHQIRFGLPVNKRNNKRGSTDD